MEERHASVQGVIYSQPKQMDMNICLERQEQKIQNKWKWGLKTL